MTLALANLAIRTLSLPSSICITSLFAHFQHKPWAMLLDSGNSERNDGRFDIMVASPIATVTSKNGMHEVNFPTSNKKFASNSPMDDIQALLGTCFDSTTLPETHLPFVCGAMGMFGYDLGRQFESIPQHAQDCFHTYDLAVGIYEWSVIKDNQSGTFYYCFFEDSVSAPSPSFIEQLFIKSTPDLEKFTLKDNWQSNLSKKKYCDALERVDTYLKAGDCYQVNFSQCFNAPYGGSEWLAYTLLRQYNHAPFSAFIRLPKSTVLSLSPERFLSVKESHVQTKPIKGTRPRSSNEIDDLAQKQALLNSEKDQAENLMIVDLLRNDLSKHCQPHSVEVTKLFDIESFAAVHHMVSTVQGKLKPQSTPVVLLQDAFPGGSITGAPKLRAMEIIDELEPHRRNIYCGSIGYIGVRQDMDTSICIRTLLTEDEQIYCWAGGGIVLDSHASSEYQESFDKVSKILPILESTIE